MLKKIIYASLLVVAGFNFSVFAQQKTVINEAKAKKMLLGKHLFSLQWISWDYFGSAIVSNKNGVFISKENKNSAKAAIL